ncbi:hypothetical protein C5167_026504 [Papaver somniferum]|nr:hypothetical protein C5167_026504 [Papaver somniferum]
MEELTLNVVFKSKASSNKASPQILRARAAKKQAYDDKSTILNYSNDKFKTNSETNSNKLTGWILNGGNPCGGGNDCKGVTCTGTSVTALLATTEFLQFLLLDISLI